MFSHSASPWAGFAAVYAVLVLALQYDPLAVAQQALLAHRDVTTMEAARSYGKWLLMNPVEFAIFAGLPLSLAAICRWWTCERSRPIAACAPSCSRHWEPSRCWSSRVRYGVKSVVSGCS